ncbi:MAG: MarR family transcriptional regulator [Oscillospiraceae bacterium]|nr:MarR family transcriptional regulator [Oscillospiraceae bacterium]
MSELPRRAELTCGELIKRISDNMAKHANENFARFDVTLSQIKMLMILDCAEGGTLPLKTVEKFFCVAQSTAAGTALRLEKKGLVAAVADPRDKRLKKIRITEAGRRVCENTRINMDEGERRLTAALTPPEAEQFRALLLKVYEGMTAEAPK